MYHYSSFSIPNVTAIFQQVPHQGGVECRVSKKCDFPPMSRVISELIQDRTILTMECE